MFKLIVRNSLILSLLVLLEGSLLPYWAGDFILVFIYFCFLDYHFSFREARESSVPFWLPIFLGLSVFNFKIDSLWMILPYFFAGAVMRSSFSLRSEWILRAKEGFLLLILNFAAFAALKVILQEIVLGYRFGGDFLLRSSISLIMGVVVWSYYYRRENSKKIR